MKSWSGSADAWFFFRLRTVFHPQGLSTRYGRAAEQSEFAKIAFLHSGSVDYMLYFKETPEGVAFKIFVQPRSSKNAVAGLHGDAIKIKLTAAPVDNAANEQCIKYLSKCFGVSKSCLEIISGHTARSKQILFRYRNKAVSGDEKEDVKKIIASLLNF
jgi:hypothetical protein